MYKIFFTCALLAISSFISRAEMKAKDDTCKNALFSMEEVILDKSAYPILSQCGWIDNSHFYVTGDDGTKTVKHIGSKNKITGAKYEEKEKSPVPDNAKNITEFQFGIVFNIGNSLYFLNKDGKKITIAQSENNDISYGKSVSRNEFGIKNGVFISPDCRKIAFYKKDESGVETFPLTDITTRTGSIINIKYPMAGRPSEIVNLGIYDIEKDSTVYVKVTDFTKERYLTNISWSNDSKKIFIMVVDREQKNMVLNMYDANDGNKIKTILTEHNDKFIEPLKPLFFIEGSDFFIYTSDNRDGYKNLYLCDLEGNIRRLTKTDADVEYISNNGKSIFYTSAEISPIENHLFRIDLSLRKKLSSVKISSPVRLTFEEGFHTIQMNPNSSYFIDTYSNFDMPGEVCLKSTDGKFKKVMDKASNPLKNHETVEVQYGTVRSADGKYDNYYRMLSPKNKIKGKKYPVIVYVYGGPHSQLVQNKWLGNVRMWEYYMAQRGYVVYVQDNRGTQNRGSEFEKAIYGRCGVAEMQDQMKGIEFLKSLPFTDADRIGVHGWSYGGFMTISLMTTYPETFKVGVAGGPVIDWKWYEVMYGERYMGTPETNPEGYKKVSLLGKVSNLKGKLLICQGVIDNVVLWQHSLNFIQECVENNVQADYFPYPLSEHNVYGKWRVHLMNKVSDYFDSNL